jgi:lipoprotein-releasing system permease protein
MIDDQFIIGGINHVRKIQDMKPDEIGGMDIFLKNVNDIDKDFPEIEKLIGYKNYAEKPLKNSRRLPTGSVFSIPILLLSLLCL